MHYSERETQGRHAVIACSYCIEFEQTGDKDWLGISTSLPSSLNLLRSTKSPLPFLRKLGRGMLGLTCLFH